MGGTFDRGLVIELELDSFALRVRDVQRSVQGPEFPIVTGSPAHPTPTGSFRAHSVVHNPSWEPGDTARRLGGEPIPASMDGPLGVGKIAFAADGIALHGGAHPLLLGKPASLGCVRALDVDFARLVEWLEGQDALLPSRPQSDGERHQAFRRPIQVVVRGEARRP
jgi:hypothetical protein